MQFLNSIPNVIEQTGTKNKENHQLQTKILMYHEIIRTDIKRAV